MITQLLVRKMELSEKVTMATGSPGRSCGMRSRAGAVDGVSTVMMRKEQEVSESLKLLCGFRQFNVNFL